MKIRKTFFLVLVLSVFFSSCENSLADILNEQFGFTRPNQLIEDEDINSEEDKKHEDDNNSVKKESFEFTYSEWNWGYELSTAKIKSAVSKITTDYVVNYRINFISESNLDGIQIQVWEYEQETSLIQWPQISKAVTAGQEYEITGSLPVYSAGDFAKSIFTLIIYHEQFNASSTVTAPSFSKLEYTIEIVKNPITWKLVQQDKLKISGKGEMPAYDYGDKQPWFEYSNEITKIEFDSTVTKIGKHAFSNFNNLKEVVIPDSVTVIDDNAFENCQNLTEIVIPDSVKEIGDMAFYNTGIRTVIIPASVEKIGSNAFGEYCKVIYEGEEYSDVPEDIPEAIPQDNTTEYKDGKVVFEQYENDGNKIWSADIQIKDYAINSIDYQAGQYLEFTITGIPDADVNEINFDTYKNYPGETWYGTRLNGMENSTYLGLFNLRKNEKFSCTTLIQCAVNGNTNSSGINMQYAFGTADGWSSDWGWSTNQFDGQLTIKDFTISVKVYNNPLHWNIAYDETLEKQTLYIDCESAALPVFNVALFNGWEGSDAPWTGHESEYSAVVFGDNIEYITEAFYLCGDGHTVDYIHLPNNVKVLGISSFWSTCSLEPIRIPSSVEYIGSHAFMKWSGCRQYLDWTESENSSRILTGLEYDNWGTYYNAEDIN